MKLSTLETIARHIGARHHGRARKAIQRALAGETGQAWHTYLGRLEKFLRDDTAPPVATIIARGNSKLPFLAFSALPGVTCPGAGDCLDWCYSFKSWRYPAAFVRQAQNTVLLQRESGREHIRQALDKFAHHGRQDFRLYVDGDFPDVEIVNFWWETIGDRPWLSTYGYTKSLAIILAANPAPDNYRLNISSGHNAPADLVEKVRALPCTRGYFLAVNIGRPVKSADHGNKAHQRELRRAYGRNAFTCPGKCDSCTPGGHACGSDRFQDIDIIIATH